ncbi:MAG: acetyl-CoA carboxylase biotin carboxyl carrier protein subunit [Myxococcaceae bacterium]|nr:acetyl-CoA carboxylase biotin carboxyl carrier protein subunit [Myxococcaceae bacterium]
MVDKKKKIASDAPAVEVRSSGGASSLDVESLRQIVEILEASEVTRLVWRNGREKLFILRGPPAVTHLMQPVMTSSAPSVHVTSSAQHLEKPRPSAPMRPTAAAPEAPVEKKGHLITSPFVGTFYRTPAPDQPSFVDVGTVVKKGQVLCIVEAMKLMNEIESEVAGKVVEILAQNAQPVEFGQPLFRIEPA